MKSIEFGSVADTQQSGEVIPKEVVARLYEPVPKAPLNYYRWTAIEKAEFIRLNRAALTYNQMATIMGKPIGAIEAHGRRLGILSTFGQRRLWPKTRFALLKKLLKAGKSYSEVGRMLGVSAGAVELKARRAGLRSSNTNNWTASETKMVKKGIAANLTIPQIAKRLKNRTPSSVDHKIYRDRLRR